MTRIIPLLLILAAPASGQTKTLVFNLPGQPLSVFGVQFSADHLGPPMATITRARARLTFTTSTLNAAHLSLAMQAKLLSVLEHRQVTRLGSNAVLDIDKFHIAPIGLEHGSHFLQCCFNFFFHDIFSFTGFLLTPIWAISKLIGHKYTLWSLTTRFRVQGSRFRVGKYKSFS